MNNYKVKVNNEAESKEAQELFFRLGYKDRKNWTQRNPIHESIQSWADGEFTFSLNHNQLPVGFKEITLPELRDLVVLKRNSIEDATHTDQDNWRWYIGVDSYVWQAGNAQQSKQWDKSSLDHVDLKPIEKTMKEYLDKDYVLRNVKQTSGDNRVPSEWIEVPEGATKLIYSSANNNLYHFANFKNKLMSVQDIKEGNGLWYGDADQYIKSLGALVVWQRPTQPEALPLVDDEPYNPFCDDGDDEPSLNDQYAEIEQVRQAQRENNHYFINVSDVDEVDFYEIAKRYNVADPAIQHILKKCLAIGNRGHKDLETDLRDILKSAKRALEINGFSL